MNVSLRCLVTAGPDADAGVLAEIVGVDLFALGATALGEITQPDGGVELVAGFETEEAAGDALTAVADRYGSQVVDAAITTHDPNWTQSQRGGLQPTRIGPWSIRAPWDDVPSNVDPLHDVVIDPGAAFGHGAHPTTVMAIELVFRHARTDQLLIDVGTGTAVIAIVAARSGMVVEAIESDPIAVDVARGNIARNATVDHPHSAAQITVHEGDAAAMLTADCDTLVVANVTLDVQRQIAPAVAAAGTVLLSGLLCRQVADAISLYPDHEARTVRTHGEWASLELRHHRRLVVAQNG